MIDAARFRTLPTPDRDLAPEECAGLARSAAALIDLADLDSQRKGLFELLWRDEHSEAWLNLAWDEPRDTGFHDHGGSCVGVHVLEGVLRAEALVVRGPRRIQHYRAGESFSAPRTAIHRVDHEPGAVTIHVYSPPLAEIGHYEVVDGELFRSPGRADEVSPPSPGLTAALESY